MRTPGAALPRTLTALMASALVLSLAGCYENGPQGTAATAIGVDADVGPMQVRSLLIVSSGEGKPGRLLGMLFNTSDRPTEVTIADEDDGVTVTVDGGGQYGFDTNPAVLPTVSEIPGSRVPITVTVASESEELLTPVLDGTLEPYRPYLP